MASTVKLFSVGYHTTNYNYKSLKKGKSVPLQAWTGPEGSRKLRFPDYVTMLQDGGRLSALQTGRLYLLNYSMVQSPC